MRKNMFKTVLAVMTIFALGIKSYHSYNTYTYTNDALLVEDVEALSISPEELIDKLIAKYGKGCVSGGVGSTSCSQSFSLDLEVVGSGGGVSISCSTSCIAGTYACCAVLGCTCKPCK